MKRATLESILDKACFFGLHGFGELNSLANVLPKLEGNKKGLLIEIKNNALFEQNAFDSVSAIPDFKEKENWQIIRNEPDFEFPKEREKLVNCYANISALKRKFERIAVMLPNEQNEFLENIEKSCIAVFNPKDVQNAGIDNLLRLKIAELNIPQTTLFLTAKYGWILALLLCALPFFIPSNADKQVSNLRNIDSEIQKYSKKGDIVHVFRDGESLTQISRFAIGKYNSLVSTDSMVQKYLKDNRLSTDKNIKAGDTLRLKLPKFKNPQHKFTQAAWAYFTGMLNDSISYITELYNIEDTSKRRHDGLDVGARKGTRILAPFSGTAITAEDERGGFMIALVKEEDILIFMHCEQRFYLYGQSVIEGDPIASVGTTGHTTGPHVHIVAGKITPKGERNFAGIRYNILDPFEWHSQCFK